MSTALYRRYRPDTFAHVIGQDHVTQPLRAALRAGRINHAYLFSGPRGCGKTTSARIMARCLNCAEGPTDAPCGTCDSCRELATGGPGSLDVVEIDAASHNGVDDARELRERAAFAPVRDRYKIFILDEAHMVTAAGFNALLKLVEEPPEHVLFIFATTEPEKVIGTIRSRTHHYPFRLVAPDVLGAYLEQLCSEEGVSLDAGVTQLVVRAGGGSVRDSLSILDQLIAGAEGNSVAYDRAVALLGYTDEALLDRTIDAIAGDDARALFDLIEHMVGSGHDPRRFVEDVLQRLRDLIIVSVAGEEAHAALPAIPADQLDRMATQAAVMGPARLTRAADLTNQTLTSMVGATSPRLHVELLAAKLLLSAGASEGSRGTEASRHVRSHHKATGKPQEPQAAMERPEPQSVQPSESQPSVSRENEPAGPSQVAASPQTIDWSDGPAPAVTMHDEASSPLPSRGDGEDHAHVPRPPAARDEHEAKQRAEGDEDSRDGVHEDAAAAAHGRDTPVGDSIDKPESPAAEIQAIGGRKSESPSEPKRAQDSGGSAEASPAGPLPESQLIRQRWDEITQTLERISRVTCARIRLAQVGAVEAGRLTLLFSSDGPANQFAQGGHCARVAQAIYETVGVQVGVEVAVGAENDSVSARQSRGQDGTGAGASASARSLVEEPADTGGGWGPVAIPGGKVQGSSSPAHAPAAPAVPDAASSTSNNRTSQHQEAGQWGGSAFEATPVASVAPENDGDDDEWILDEAETRRNEDSSGPVGGQEDEDLSDALDVSATNPQTRACGVEVITDFLGGTIIDEKPLA